MLKLSKRVEYALMALLYMDGTSGDVVVSAREIVEQFRLPPELMGKVLQVLARAGLVESMHGAKGGYRLARTLDEVSLPEVIEAVDGKMRIVPCQGKATSCERYNDCIIRDPVHRIQRQLMIYLDGIKLSAFREPGAKGNVKRIKSVERALV